MKKLCSVLGITINELLEGKILSESEQIELLEKNTLSILTTKKQLENMQILTEILIFMEIIITITLTSLIATTFIQKIIVLIIGCFIWGFGLLLRIKLRKAMNKID